jgi:ABC-type polar amino acid transport system ATPase subunit
MSERLIVKNFLCLKDIDLEVKDFLILIGPQAAGKSLCAKLLYFFRVVFEEIVIYGMASALGKPLDFYKILSEKFESFFPKSYWSEQDFAIEYHLDSQPFFSIKKEKNQELTLYPDQGFLEAYQRIQQSYQRTIEAYPYPEKRKEVLKIITDKQFELFMDNNIFIPAGRSFFSLLQKNIFSFLRTSNNVDPFLMEFGGFYESIKQHAEHSIPVEAQALIHSILKGDYVYAENCLVLPDGSKIAPELLSSGQQEALPLALVLAYIISLRLESYKFTIIYVEEPEAHLFPNAQEEISRLISFVQNISRQEVKFVITTHSPYILSAFNNLIKAGNIVKQNLALKDMVCKEIPESMHIDIDRFSAYALEDGKAVNIIDTETNLINADAIDGVSESIMETFNTLLDIEFDGNEVGENV